MPAGIRIGDASSGEVNQNSSAIAIGNSAGFEGQSNNAIAIGLTAGHDNQGEKAIAIGEGQPVVQTKSNICNRDW